MAVGMNYYNIDITVFARLKLIIFKNIKNRDASIPKIFSMSQRVLDNL